MPKIDVVLMWRRRPSNLDACFVSLVSFLAAYLTCVVRTNMNSYPNQGPDSNSYPAPVLDSNSYPASDLDSNSYPGRNIIRILGNYKLRRKLKGGGGEL